MGRGRRRLNFFISPIFSTDSENFQTFLPVHPFLGPTYCFFFIDVLLSCTCMNYLPMAGWKQIAIIEYCYVDLYLFRKWNHLLKTNIIIKIKKKYQNGQSYSSFQHDQYFTENLQTCISSAKYENFKHAIYQYRFKQRFIQIINFKYDSMGPSAKGKYVIWYLLPCCRIILNSYLNEHISTDLLMS